jgi:uncharacterized protein (DUF1697 family)
MIVFISMLRGVNVGGHNIIKMEALRALYESLGLAGAQTHIQSGNVVFRAKEKDSARLAKKIGDAIERTFGFCPPVILRTSGELRQVIAKNPFVSRKDINPGKLVVFFLATDPGAEIREKILAIKPELEEIRFDGRELSIYFPNGMGKTKLSIPKIEKLLQTPATARNWNTVQKLLEMAESLEGVR